jgi:hypothetical protein
LSCNIVAATIVNNNSTQLNFDHASCMEEIVSLPIVFFHSSNTKHSKRNKAIVSTFIGLDLILIIFKLFIMSWTIFLGSLSDYHSPCSFTIMVLLLGHWVATCPRPWHLWHTISLLHVEEVAAEVLAFLNTITKYGDRMHPQQWRQKCLLAFLNAITKYGDRIHPQQRRQKCLLLFLSVITND